MEKEKTYMENRKELGRNIRRPWAILKASGHETGHFISCWLTASGSVRSNCWLSFFCPSVPVSQPVLTLRPLGIWNLVTDKISLQCEVQRGSLPIWYQFFHEDVLLKEIKSTSERKMFHRLSPTEKHSGNYYCTADNGLGPQWSKAMSK